jgi:hypothetical protein
MCGPQDSSEGALHSYHSPVEVGKLRLECHLWVGYQVCPPPTLVQLSLACSPSPMCHQHVMLELLTLAGNPLGLPDLQVPSKVLLGGVPRFPQHPLCSLNYAQPATLSDNPPLRM